MVQSQTLAPCWSHTAFSVDKRRTWSRHDNEPARSKSLLVPYVWEDSAKGRALTTSFDSSPFAPILPCLAHHYNDIPSNTVRLQPRANKSVTKFICSIATLTLQGDTHNTFHLSLWRSGNSALTLSSSRSSLTSRFSRSMSW